MKNGANQDWQKRYQELDTVCRIWVAASEAKDAHIEQLTRERQQLRNRLVRMERRLALVKRCETRGGRPAALRRTPTSA